MPGRRIRTRASLALCAAFVSVFVLCILCIPAFSDTHIVQPVNGDYSDTFAANWIRVEYSDTDHGQLSLGTFASGYADFFYLIAGAFSGSHTVDAYSLDRQLEFSGNGHMEAGSQSDNASVTISAEGSSLTLSQNVDFGNAAVDPPGVVVHIDFKDPSPAHLEIFATGDQAQITSFARAFGLSGAQATTLYTGGIVGLIAQLSRAGYSPIEIVRLALERGLDHVRELLAKLRSQYVPTPPDQAVRKFGIPWEYAHALFRESAGDFFSLALAHSEDYGHFIGNLRGWTIAGAMPAYVEDGLAAAVAGTKGSVAPGPFVIANATTVAAGEPIQFVFRALHPMDPDLVLTDPWLRPYLNLVRIRDDGGIEALAGYYSYITFQLNPRTGNYFSYIDTSGLAPGKYIAFLSVRSAPNGITEDSRIAIEIREPLQTYCWR